MKYIFVLIIIQLANWSNAFEKRELVLAITLQSSVKNEQLKVTESRYVFQFFGFNDVVSERTVLFSIDGKNSNQKLDSKNNIPVNSTPGNHLFQFYYSDKYFEITSDSLHIKAQYINTYEVRFESSEFPVMVDKPVIYLYPEIETSFAINVNPKGKMAFTYPSYTDKWKGTAFPNGDIKIGSETFNYLFWESNQTINANIIDSKKGAIIKREETLAFLENQLNKFGFTSKEKADFITYWGPKLALNEFNYIYFVLNKDANYFAELTITPQPDNIYRFHILTCPVVNPSDFYYLEPQLIEPTLRKGFTVIEWGGSVIDIQLLKKQLQIL